MNQCDFKTVTARYDALQKYVEFEPIRDSRLSEAQCLLPLGHVGSHVCRVGEENIEFPNREMPTKEGVLLELYQRSKAGKPTDDFADVLGLSDRLNDFARALGVTGKAAHRAIARELTKRDTATDEPHKKRLIKI